jgi:hypothetical protein
MSAALAVTHGNISAPHGLLPSAGFGSEILNRRLAEPISM